MNNEYYTNLYGGKKKRKNKRSTSNMIKQDTNVPLLDTIINKRSYQEDFATMCPGINYMPSIFPPVKRIVVLGDIHGDYSLALQMLKLGNLVKIQENNIIWIGGDTHVVQVGDQIDRCRPMGTLTCDNPMATYNDEASDIKILKLFTDLDNQALKSGGRVISLLGNHELLNSQGQLSYVSHLGIKEFESYKDPTNPLVIFGSAKEARKYAFAPGKEYGKLMGCTRLSSVIIGDNLFVHAGIVNGLIEELRINKNTDLETINIAVSKWLLGLINVEYVDRIISSSKHSMFWNRILGSIPPNLNFEDPLCIDQISMVLQLLQVGSIIIGHTPQSFTYSDGINKTCNRGVIRVDNGSSSAFSKFDYQFMSTGKTTDSRKPQVLEILTTNNESKYYVITESGKKPL